MTRVVLIFVAIASGCAVSRTFQSNPSEPGHCAERVLERLYFGSNTPGGVIGEVDWRTFVERAITPLFPDGFTVFEGEGQWRGASKRIEREPSRVVEIVHSGSGDARRRIASIAKEYKRLFQQESVLIVRIPVAACFEGRYWIFDRRMRLEMMIPGQMPVTAANRNAMAGR